MWAAIWRFIRVLAGQAIALVITQTAGITLPFVNIALGSAISMVCKFLRDKYPSLDWLPL